MSIILNGKDTSEKIKLNLKQKCDNLFKLKNIQPTLAIVIVGDDPASQIYVASKERSCAQVGIISKTIRLCASATQADVEQAVTLLANDKSINGLMVQLPLPKGLDENKILAKIPPEKDVDGLTLLSGGACLFSQTGFTPCTPKGIITILKEYNISFKGKNAVVVGRSNMVGKPIALKLLEENCTVTICHSRTENLANHTKNADILVVAVGKKHLITGEMIKPGAVVVDVGINRVDGKLYGDVHFDSAEKIASFITPVPGGIGPMTVTMLLTNTYEACLKQNGLNDEF